MNLLDGQRSKNLKGQTGNLKGVKGRWGKKNQGTKFAKANKTGESKTPSQPNLCKFQTKAVGGGECFGKRGEKTDGGKE